MDEQDNHQARYSRATENNHESHDMNNKYMDSEPIQEYTREEDMTASPLDHQQYEEMIRQRCKFLFFDNLVPNFNDKLHLVWERERLQRKRDNYEKRRDPMRIQEFLKERKPDFSISTTRGKLAEYDFLKPTKRKQAFIDDMKSSVPLLSDHYQNSATHQSAALPNAKSFQKTYDQFTRRKGSEIGSIFKQSEYQNRLKNNSVLDQFKAPLSHHSLNKLGSSGYMHITESYAKVPVVQEGRNRMFYTSQIF